MKTMKHTPLLSAGLLCFLALIFSGCSDKVEITRIYTVMEPVYMSPAQLREAVDVIEPQDIHATGKIYLYQHYLLVNEPGKGIHLVNNLNPESPEMLGFINIPGNYDLAVRGDVLYADSYVDLVALDISDVQNIREVNRLKDIFAGLSTTEYYDPEKGVIVDWNEVEKIEVTEEEFEGNFPSYFNYRTNGIAFASADMASTMSSFMPPTVQTGVGGSMARFTIVENYLYSVDNTRLYVFDISNLNDPKQGMIKDLGWGIETIFPYDHKLFIGSQTGMHIYDIENPDVPIKLSVFEHVRSCDPVVVADTLAYVTLRSGNFCNNGFANQLDVINIKDPTQPEILISYPMANPHGLGIDNGILFLCEGNFGLKIFDATDPMSIDSHLLQTYTGVDAIDVIPFNDVLIMIGTDGLYQYDYSDIENIRLLSALPVIPEPSDEM
ncbi:MAG TPA: hypothetical protein VI583_18180 [Cyclobacteriaceae bacterium]|nr:hypothetical protein [Cyclobacteriaceae bacterium]